MRGRLLLLTVLLVLGALVVALNWAEMGASLRLELLFGAVDVSVGLVVLIAALVPALVLLLAGLLDRARELRRVDVLERRLEEARAAAERARSVEIEALGRTLEERIEALRVGVDAVVQGSEARLEARFEGLETALGDRLDDLRERVVLVRDELAADIAEAEDTLLRGRAPALPEADEEADVDDA